mmetsp:Transcript_90020/g.160262  ORF Transcript_90020/g.160262 Transcript_90020/m.160262 type:complete len:846 (-) Transcript_90020:141-2678(-)
MSRRSSAATAGRSIVGLGSGAPEAARVSSASKPSRLPNAQTAVTRPSSRAGGLRPSSRAGEGTRPSSRGGTLPPIGRPSTGQRDQAVEALDGDVKAGLLKVFAWCDADGDGALSPAEFAAAQRLVAELCPAQFDESAASSIFEKARGSAGWVDENGFLTAAQSLISALQLPRRELLKGLARQTSGKATGFDRSVSDLKHALVRNVSNLADDGQPVAPPPPTALWRTATGGSSFVLPPGAAGGPAIARVAFKLMQYLAMRTEDNSIIEGGLAAKMMGHRRMFKDMLDLTGEIVGVHVPSGSRSSVDLFMMKSPEAEQIFRVRILGLQLSAGPDLKLVGMGSFDAGPVDVDDVPTALREEMKAPGGIIEKVPNVTAAEAIPPAPAALTRQSSMLADQDLQNAELVLTASPVARHSFRIRLKLSGGKSPVSHYVMLVPRLKAAESGHARYADHKISLLGVGKEALSVSSFDNFVLANLRGPQLQGLEVQHEFTSSRVRVQPRAGANPAEVVPVPKLNMDERACNLAVEKAQAEQLRSLLDAQGLGRRSGERDIAFAVRLGRALCNGYEYDVAITDAHVKNLPPLIWEHRRGDCSAFNAGFVYALRCFGVPARVSLGFKYGRAVAQACGSVVAPHAQAEFFAEDVGWVPCDATLGLRRLGHEGAAVLTFVEWRPATMSVSELQELSKVLTTVKPWPRLQGLQKFLEENHGATKVLSSKELRAGLSTACNLPASVAQASVEEVLELCEKEKLLPKDFVNGLAAAELGIFRELGTGGGLAEASRAGLKLFEGGPFAGEPLDVTKLKENMLVPESMSQVMEHVGARPQDMDWSQMWPYGVFSCSYDFEEKLL